MSVQFGKCNFDGKPVDPKDLDEARPVLAPYGPDGENCICRANFGILYGTFYTTNESRRETQPHISASGWAITWDGRLDNREELIGQLADGMSHESSDLEIVAASYERWGIDAFRKLIGDWALSIWDSKDRSLILAKDFVGTRHLYYSVEKEQVTWCTVLDPLVLFSGHAVKLEEEYIAGWLSFFPAPHLTPYFGIHSVPPCSFVRLARGTQRVSKYWDFDPQKRIHYRTDAEYEEHFRYVFADSVRRRLRSDTPILAELSGGIDSSSIVCMADILLAQGMMNAPRLDTVSYFDDSEPNWDERPYFTKVEEKRGRAGCHIDTSTHDLFSRKREQQSFAATPSAVIHFSQAAEQFASCLTSKENRIVLTGTGGDETLGGVPTPFPELDDLLARVCLRALVRQLKCWALNKRKPWFFLLFEAVRGFLPQSFATLRKHKQTINWLHPEFVHRHQAVLSKHRSRLKLLGALPSFQMNMATLEVLRRELACHALPSEPTYENRHPYLDRDLLEFAFAVPPEQFVRPGQRRSLMRRALRGIVPHELLNRKRKAFVTRGPRAALLAERDNLAKLEGHMISDSLGFIDRANFSEALRRAQQDPGGPIAAIMRSIGLEIWLRDLMPGECWTAAQPKESRQAIFIPCPSGVFTSKQMPFSAENNPKQGGGENS